MKTLTKTAMAMLIVMLFTTFKSYSQTFCLTKTNIPDALQAIPPGQWQAGSTHYCIRIFVHIMRRTNGTGGQTLAEVNQGLNILRADYVAHDISFLLIGTDEILNDTYYNQTGFAYDANLDGKFDNFSPNSHTNAIDIYMFGNDVLNSGQAAFIPATALVIGGAAFGINLASSHVLSHEMGHCLGLYHTFHGMNCEGPSVFDLLACHELVNGSNCAVCGDYVCDTPADPTRFNVNQSTCLWPGTVASCEGSLVDANSDPYAPDPNLIMAYVAPNCMAYHSVGQGTRMNSMIANSTLLLGTVESPGSADLSSQDFTNDLGFEPNPDNGAMWISEDIWVRHIPDGLTNHTHLNPEAGQINYVYVKVRNIGCVASSGSATELVKLYWAKASSALSWDAYWNNSLTCSGSGASMGNIIGSQQIVSIPAGGEHIFEFQWNPNLPVLYTNCNLCYNQAEFWHFCLLARIVDTNLPDDGMTFPETTDLYSNVRNNNNIVWKNLHVDNIFLFHEDGKKDRLIGDGGTIGVGNVFDHPECFNVEFRLPKDFIGMPTPEEAIIKITLPKATWDIWMQGGAQMENIKIENFDARELTVTGNPAKLKNLCYEKEQWGTIHVGFNVLADWWLDGKGFNTYDVIEKLASDNKKIIGGEQYELRYEGKLKTSEPIASETFSYNGVYPNPNNGTMQMDYILNNSEKGELVIYDYQGRNIATYSLMEGKNTLIIQEPLLSNGIYIYQVKVNDKMVANEKLVIIK